MRDPAAEKRRRLRRRELDRHQYTQRVMVLHKQVSKDRIQRSFEEASFNAFRGDLHVHSFFSDGTATVDELKLYADAAGLDFFFVTDHGTVNQKRTCKKYPTVWWGQEPGTQHHHLVILDIDRKYTPRRDLAYDYDRAKKIGGFPFIPHPAGWFPDTRYTQEQMDALDLLGNEFAMEIVNGANQVFDCWDVTDERSVQLWDKHLCQGKRVTGLGCTDAHLPQAMGDIWTGVLSDRLHKDAVIDAVRRGHCFVSDAPLLNISANGAPMGDIVHARAGENITLELEWVDSLGLASARVVKDGREIALLAPGGKTRAQKVITDTFAGGKSYYRAECLAVDRRRAYTNPIYVREA